MKDFVKFLKSTGIYFAGTVLMKIITFFLMPIYTSFIPPADMGVYNLHQSYVTFVCAALYLDIWSSVMRYFFDYHEEEGQKKVINSGLAIFFVSSMVYTVIVLAIRCVSPVPYLSYIYLYGLLQNLQYFFGYLARVYGKNVLYASAGIVTSLVTAVSNIVLIVVFGMDYRSMFLSACIGYACNVLMIARGVQITRILSIHLIDREMFRKLMRFSLPLSVNSIAYWFLTSYCSVAVTHMLGEQANGKYAIARQFGSFVSLFTTCFTMAWQEISYVKESEQAEGRGEFYSRAVNAYIEFLGMGISVILAVIYLIYPFFVRGEYGGSREMVPVYLVATVASAVSSFLGNIFTAVKRNDILFYTTVVSSVVSVGSVHLLVPLIGIQGASIALLAGFLTNIITRILILRKEVRIRIGWRSILPVCAVLLLAMGAYLAGGIVVNVISAVVCLSVMAFTFRDMIAGILRKVIPAGRRE